MRSSKPVQTYTGMSFCLLTCRLCFTLKYESVCLDEGLHKYCSLGVNCTGKMIAAGTEATATDSFVIFW